jgi:hypothetical protein
MENAYIYIGNRLGEFCLIKIYFITLDIDKALNMYAEMHPRRMLNTA